MKNNDEIHKKITEYMNTQIDSRTYDFAFIKDVYNKNLISFFDPN